MLPLPSPEDILPGVQMTHLPFLLLHLGINLLLAPRGMASRSLVTLDPVKVHCFRGETGRFQGALRSCGVETNVSARISSRGDGNRGKVRKPFDDFSTSIAFIYLRREKRILDSCFFIFGEPQFNGR